MDIVNAEDSCSGIKMCHAEGEGSGQAFAGEGVCVERDAADEAFARECAEEGAAGGSDEVLGGGEQKQIILDGFSKAQTGIDEDCLWVDTRFQGGGDATLGEECGYIRDETCVGRWGWVTIRVVVAGWREKPVHEDEGGVSAGHGKEEGGVGGRSGDIINYICAGIESCGCYLGGGGVDAEDGGSGEGFSQASEDGEDATELFGWGNRL